MIEGLKIYEIIAILLNILAVPVVLGIFAALWFGAKAMDGDYDTILRWCGFCRMIFVCKKIDYKTCSTRCPYCENRDTNFIRPVSTSYHGVYRDQNRYELDVLWATDSYEAEWRELALRERCLVNDNGERQLCR